MLIVSGDEFQFAWIENQLITGLLAMNSRILFFYVAVHLLFLGSLANGQSVFLYNANMSVELGPSMAPEPFANRTTADSLNSIIDLSSADASELHTQTTHIWVSGGSLELVFDLGAEYDLEFLHFWNYHGEFYDVDDIDLTFFDSEQVLVGATSIVSPALGNDTGSDATPIFAEDFPLTTSTGIRFVNVVLTGSNNQVDFNNLGFTGVLVPEPGTFAMLLVGLCLGGMQRVIR